MDVDLEAADGIERRVGHGDESTMWGDFLIFCRSHFGI
jgi:hypothetical protein